MILNNVLIIGASSAIAQETAREFARHGARLVITARTQQKLDVLKNDLLVHGARQVETILFDALKHFMINDPISEAVSRLGSLDAVLIAYGSLPDNAACALDVSKTIEEFTLNATSVIAVCTRASAYFEQQRSSEKSACIAVIGSVAGDRGRQSNYIYGSSKGAVHIFLQGLRNRLYDRRIAVVTIKPGFVDTPMTAHLPKSPLFTSARKVGTGVHRAMTKGKDIVYLPGFWRYIMFIVRLIPESIFKTMKL